MKNLRRTALAIIAILPFFGCEKGELIEREERDKVQFFAHYLAPEGGVLTKSPTTFSSGNRASLFIYETGANTINQPITREEAVANGQGELVSTPPIYLPKGNYDFYSISLNNSSSPSGISFTGGSSAQLENGVDYLWASSKVKSSSSPIIFTYSHSAVKMAVTVESTIGVDNLVVSKVEITPSLVTSESKMKLSDGEIGLSQGVGAKVAMVKNGAYWEYIMLPSKGIDVKVTVTLSAKIGEKSITNREYQVQIPKQQFEAGNHYRLKLTLSASQLSFTGAKVEEWEEKTITGIELD